MNNQKKFNYTLKLIFLQIMTVSEMVRKKEGNILFNDTLNSFMVISDVIKN